MLLKQKGSSAQIGAFKQLKVSLIWTSAVDLDLMAFYKTKTGQVGGVYSSNYAGGSMGDLNAFPFMQLSGDEGVGATGGDNREEMRIVKLDDMEELHICAVNFTDAAHGSSKVFADYDARVEVVTDQGETHVVSLDSRDPGTVAVLCKLKSGFLGTELLNNSEVLTFDDFKAMVPGAGAIELKSKLSVEKKLEKYGKNAHELLPLAKKAEVLLKQKGLGDHVAAVALVMDVSGSMSGMFQDGTVQTVIERVMGLGLNFDDNGAIDIFAFSDKAYDLGEMTPDAFKTAAQWILKQVRMGGTNYAPAIRQVMEHYGYAVPGGSGGGGGFLSRIFGSSSKPTQELQQKPQARLPADYPAYVLFVTDGDAMDRGAAEKAITEASRYPMFFQFVGIGGSSFSFLDKLDNMGGRFIDNANFFAVSNPASTSDSELYSKMMGEYPDYLKAARAKKLIK